MRLVYTYISNSGNVKVISEVLVLKENKHETYTPHYYLLCLIYTKSFKQICS